MDAILDDPKAAWSNLVQNVLEAIQSAKDFDVRTPADLYKIFTMCHLFSWAVILYKMRNI